MKRMGGSNVCGGEGACKRTRGSNVCGGEGACEKDGGDQMCVVGRVHVKRTGGIKCVWWGGCM